MDYDALAVELLENMHALRKARMQKDMEEGLQGEKRVLHFIANRGDNVQPGDIVQDMQVSAARIAQTLNGIEKKGLIIRHIDNSDRRRILITITPEGIDLAEAHMRNQMQSTAEMLRLLGENDAREHVRIMGRLAALMSEENKSQEG
ncbi:MAG: MarR family transcriptional regulator [Clostridiales bacterium]|nr:MarR family transcriptional regulator [Clostridiales bacterium]